jgi:hypothetical protein
MLPLERTYRFPMSMATHGYVYFPIAPQDHTPPVPEYSCRYSYKYLQVDGNTQQRCRNVAQDDTLAGDSVVRSLAHEIRI